MPTVTPLARVCVAIAMIAFGLQHLIYGDFVTRVLPKLSTHVAPHSLGAYLAGVLLTLSGVAMLIRKTARPAALLLGAVILFSFLFLYLPLLTKSQLLGALWTNAGKALALAGACFLVARSLPKQDLRSALLTYLERLTPLAPFFLGAFFVLAGIQHFIFTGFVATLVPSWIPAHVFWTYFAGVALIAGGIGIMIPFTARLAGTLSGVMIFLWVILLHIPRAVAAPSDSNETTAVFEALAVSAAAFLVASTAQSRAQRINP